MVEVNVTPFEDALDVLVRLRTDAELHSFSCLWTFHWPINELNLMIEVTRLGRYYKTYLCRDRYLSEVNTETFETELMLPSMTTIPQVSSSAVY